MKSQKAVEYYSEHTNVLRLQAEKEQALQSLKHVEGALAASQKEYQLWKQRVDQAIRIYTHEQARWTCYTQKMLEETRSKSDHISGLMETLQAETHLVKTTLQDQYDRGMKMLQESKDEIQETKMIIMDMEKKKHVLMDQLHKAEILLTQLTTREVHAKAAYEHQEARNLDANVETIHNQNMYYSHS
jgi:hypothetical protein